MKVHGVRAMLNKPGFCSTAAIVAEVEDTSAWDEGCGRRGKPATKHDFPDATFQITDCSRAIYMEVHFSGDDEQENNLYKIDTMIDALQQFRDGMVIEYERHVQRQKSIKDKSEDD